MSSKTKLSFSPKILEFAFHHCVLGPQVPCKQEELLSESGDLALVDLLIHAAKDLRDEGNQIYLSAWQSAFQLLQDCRQLRIHGRLDKSVLKQKFASLDVGHTLVLHIEAQNAGLIIRRSSKDTVDFEAFEASPSTRTVLKASAPLLRTFPGSSASVPWTIFEDPGFRDALSEFLENGSSDPVREFAATAMKGGTSIVESRDTPAPTLISSFLMTLLQAIGHASSIPLTQKHVRDEVSWNDGAQKPWRRSPFWLVLRVALQRCLCQQSSGFIGRVLYKFLISYALSHLCGLMCDSNSSAEYITLIKTKLARRMAKLQTEKENTQPDERFVFDSLFQDLAGKVQASLAKAASRLERQWSKVQSASRDLKLLPQRAVAADLTLSMHNSRNRLEDIMKTEPHKEPAPAMKFQSAPRMSVSPGQLPAADFSEADTTDRMLKLFDFETWVESKLPVFRPTPGKEISTLQRITKLICAYKDHAVPLYKDDAESNSVMLLTIFELWVAVDKIAVDALPLLKSYRTGFPAHLFDTLLLSSLHDMKRVFIVEKYIEERNAGAQGRLPLLFSDPSEGCFAEAYYDQNKSMQSLRDEILLEAEKARANKTKEYETMKARYESLQSESYGLSCVFMVDERNPRKKKHDFENCTKCLLKRRMKRIRDTKIKVHEWPLPDEDVKAKAVIFELQCPAVFEYWRNATWTIVRDLCHSKVSAGQEPWEHLLNYAPLIHHASSQSSLLTLASKRKSFLGTHYKFVTIPNCNLADVCTRNDLDFRLFDVAGKLWLSEVLATPGSLATFMQLGIPPASPLAPLDSPADKPGQTPNESIAAQCHLPNGVTFQEHWALKDLLSGSYTRFPRLLRELASNNINLSDEATSSIISRVSLQAGRRSEASPLRESYWVFEDEHYCDRLLEHLDARMNAVAGSWRESVYMNSVLTLLLRCFDLSPSTNLATRAAGLIQKLRRISLTWINSLRSEVRKQSNAEVHQRRSSDAYQAALLCRRTFAMELETSDSMDEVALQSFLESSIALQEYLPEPLLNLPPAFRKAAFRDLRLVHRLEGLIRRSIARQEEAISNALNAVLPIPEDARVKYTKWNFLPAPNDMWLVAETKRRDDLARPQTTHLNVFDGTLLVAGRKSGPLPSKYTKSKMFKELFGEGRFRAYLSSVQGMMYTLEATFRGHAIHVGLRGKSTVVIRASTYKTTLELIPADIFLAADSEHPSDLPRPLIANHVHWLDLLSKKIEIRPRESMWKPKESDWNLNLDQKEFQAWRRGNSRLVDPRSRSFLRIAACLEPFEHRNYLVVFQPRGSVGTTVFLERMNISFEVKDGQLESRQLRARISLDQNIHTFYGLMSKLVLEDVADPRKKSILVPIPDPSCPPVTIGRSGGHVAVTLNSAGQYCRFVVNEILGRLESPTEPRLFYLKCFIHAITTYPLPDPLTGQTGVEEALEGLASSYAQPWCALDAGSVYILSLIGKLTPDRSWYPKELKVLQRVSWDPHMSIWSQHDSFRPLVQKILIASEQLRAFQQGATPSDLDRFADSDLFKRSRYSNARFSRNVTALREAYESQGALHLARDRMTADERSLNVREVSQLVQNWSSQGPITKNLCQKLNKAPSIRGFFEEFEKGSIGALLDLDMRSHWGPLFTLAQQSTRRDTFKLMFFLSTIAFREKADMSFIRTLICISVSEKFHIVERPNFPSYQDYQHSQAPKSNYLSTIISSFRAPFGEDDSSTEGFLDSEENERLADAEAAHNLQTEKDVAVLVDFLLAQWPCQRPSLDGLDRSLLIDLNSVMDIIRPTWERLYENSQLTNHLLQVQSLLRQEDVPLGPRRAFPPVEPTIFFARPQNTKVVPSLGELLEASSCEEEECSDIMFPKNQNQTSSDNRHTEVTSIDRPEFQELAEIIAPLRESENLTRRQQGAHLQSSLDALLQRGQTNTTHVDIKLADLNAVIQRQERALDQSLDGIRKALSKDGRFRWLKYSLWPGVTRRSILSSLSSVAQQRFGPNLKRKCISLGVSVCVLQRFFRIENAIKNKTNVSDAVRSLHESFSPFDYPDWLVLEVESDVSIRPKQVDVALATISPASNANSIVQLAMGEGKTALILPMVISILANSKDLIRVIVPRALLLQTAQMFQSKLGCLLNHPVKHVPFSRRTPTNRSTIEAYLAIHHATLQQRGVMLAEPAHILSFKLSGQQRLLDGRHEEASQMLKAQAWINTTARDVIDEVDNILAVRTQLIYPSGALASVDGQPGRWKTIEAVLSLVRHHLPAVSNANPRGIELVGRSDGFPTACFLRKEAEDLLLSLVAQDLVKGYGAVLPLQNQQQSILFDILCFVQEAKPGCERQDRIMQMLDQNSAAVKDILLLRGLFAHRILIMALNKRWNVQYGLHPNRDPIAVPFEAKGVPSESAEFGHTDVSILLTCLSFYYQGLSYEQFTQALSRLLRSEDPTTEFDLITNTCVTLSQDSSITTTGINLDDEQQIRNLWQHLSHNMSMVNQWLNFFVFPRFAKQFEKKLQSSAWDIPLFTPRPAVGGNSATTSADSCARTTGFSGTNDNRTLLPLVIEQNDLPALAFTNAEVLSYFLLKRNRRYECTRDSNGHRLSEEGFLHRLKTERIRVLIDSGALILEMDNLSLVQKWLTIDYEAEAAIFFTASNKPAVCYRNGKTRSLNASPFAENMETCLVYIDEEHTRGIDLKLPPYAVGALTLGLSQTKDQTCQGAMRLRQLSTTQSVVFFAPPEVNQSIIDFQGLNDEDNITSVHVLKWLLEQTSLGIERLQPLYISQGFDYCTRLQASLDHPLHLVDDSHNREAYSLSLQQRENFSLQELYGLKSPTNATTERRFSSPELIAISEKLSNMKSSFVDSSVVGDVFSQQEVEQEREVTVEVETVRELEKPPPASALRHNLHEDVQKFAADGRIVPSSEAYLPLLSILRDSAIGREFGVDSTETSTKLFATVEFAKTVKLNKKAGRSGDLYLRPVEWILWNTKTEKALVISPFEAEKLLPSVRDSNTSLTHLLVYAAPATRRMLLAFNDMKFYSVPELPKSFAAPNWLVQELGLFGGRLYFTFEELHAVYTYLGLKTQAGLRENTTMGPDMEGNRQRTFHLRVKEPLAFLKEWLMIRRRGQDFSSTPMGYVTQGKRLSERDIFFGGSGEADTEDKQNANDAEVSGSASADGGVVEQIDEHDIEEAAAEDDNA